MPYLRSDIVAEVSPVLGARQTAELPVVVVRSQTVVTTSLDISGSQVPAERFAVAEQVVSDL